MSVHRVNEIVGTLRKKAQKKTATDENILPKREYMSMELAMCNRGIITCKCGSRAAAKRVVNAMQMAAERRRHCSS